MNKSVMKCCICNNENIGEFITINDEKYHLCCIEQLQQENKQLKENLQQEKKDFKEANDYCFELKDYKSRCEKALEYLDKIETLAMSDGKIIFSINTFRNILQNEKK